MPTTAPALNMPLTTEQPLRAITAVNNKNKFSFFMVEYISGIIPGKCYLF